MDKWFNVGKIVNTHGLQGEVRVISKTDFPEERYKKGNILHIFANNQTEPIEVKVAGHRIHKTFDLLTFEGYTNVNDVEKLKGMIIKVTESQLTDLGEDEFYFHEIIDCMIKTTEGEEIGIVTDILTPGANDVWIIKDKNGKEILIPYIEDVVLNININDKVIIIHPMEGLLS